MEKCYGSMFFLNRVFLSCSCPLLPYSLSLFHRFLVLPPGLKLSVICTLSASQAAFSSPYLEVITLSGGAPPRRSLLLLCGVLSVNKGTWEFLPHINEPQALKGPLFF